MELKKLGLFLFSEGRSSAALKDDLQRLEKLGYGALWFAEAVGREPFSFASFVLNNTTDMVAATGIINIYWRDAVVAAMGQQTLNEMSGGRFLLGLGVSHAPTVEGRGITYGKPVATMRNYVEQVKACHAGISVTNAMTVDGFGPQEVGVGGNGVVTTTAGEMPIVLAALGPKMTALAAEISQGSHPYNTTPEHTAKAREIMGPDAMLCPMQRVCISNDAGKVRAIGRQLLGFYFTLPNYTNMLKALGFGDDDFQGGGSDKLVDAMIAWGGEDAIRARVQEHMDAGATHVCVQTVNVDDPKAVCWDSLEALAA
jgi:probable F420-dependent oxidoreductase